jgi:hypothetical protein
MQNGMEKGISYIRLYFRSVGAETYDVKHVRRHGLGEELMDEVMVEHEYPYRRRWIILTSVTVLSGVLAAGSLLQALAGDRLMGLWFGIFGAAFALCALLWWKRRRAPRRRIAFIGSGLLLPKGWWKTEEKFVAYSDITDLTFVRWVGVASGQVRTLELRTSQDLFRIEAEDFAEERFHGICDLLLGRVSPDLALSVGPSFWLNEAAHLDRHGEWARALAYYKRAAEALSGHPDGEYAKSCIKCVEEKLSRATW